VTEWNKRFFLSVAALFALTFGIFMTPGLLSPITDAQDSIDPLALTGEYDASEVTGTFQDSQVIVPTEQSLMAQVSANPDVLGDSDAEKHIEVDLTNQRVYAYEGDTKVYDFLVSTGKWGRTPTGEFTIWGKFRATKMSGGSKERGTYYYLPNVPYVMFFSNSEIPAARGFSFHGTYWHENFGTPMSHGCINMKTEEAALLYAWADPDVGDKKMMRATKENPGTRVVIYGESP
jgi:lipoprotein-anchoring transpeptidase ErfK/SrfK